MGTQILLLHCGNLWNSLPEKKKEVEGIDEFKKAVRDYMF